MFLCIKCAFVRVIYEYFKSRKLYGSRSSLLVHNSLLFLGPILRHFNPLTPGIKLRVKSAERQDLNYRINFFTQTLTHKQKIKIRRKTNDRPVQEWPKLIDAYAASSGNPTLHPATQPVCRSASKI